MGAIYLVRHGQAAFGTHDYDRLTDIGFAQARLLGAYFGARDIRFDAVYTGTLRRHAETARAILEAGAAIGRDQDLQAVAGLDEYNPEALIAALEAASAALGPARVPLAAGARNDPGLMREHFRRLREALLAWSENRIQPSGMPAWQAFQRAAVEAVTDARRRFPDGNVLLVSSGGPIAAIVASALQSPAQVAIELNLRIRNSAVTEFTTSARRHQLICFNTLPHLAAQSDARLTTYA
jgi:broad specificity phosphatase PhoE